MKKKSTKKKKQQLIHHKYFAAVVAFVAVGSLTGIALLAANSSKNVSVSADSNSINFESPAYATGIINGQNGWQATGSAGSGCAIYDQAVATQSGYPSFGGQSFRISDAVTSGCFGDQAFAKPLVDAVGETGATLGSFSAGNRQTHFETQFDIASVLPTAQQSGLHISVSPDRGDGSRMSYLRFEDGANGIDVFFDDVQQASNPANFVETQIATGLDRTKPHAVKLTLDTFEGPSNDVVKVSIDGTLLITGTSWENYYRYDSESAAEQSPRIVKTMLFRSSGSSNPANAGKGFYIDNLTLKSGAVTVGPPTNIKQCTKKGWKTFNNPTFKNLRECVWYVIRHKGGKYDHKYDNDSYDEDHGKDRPRRHKPQD